MSETKHACQRKWWTEHSINGPAIDECREDPDGTFWCDNGEYSSQVDYCPICGAAAPTKIGPEPDLGCNMGGYLVVDHEAAQRYRAKKGQQ
jgi:hypothetical protein